MKKGNRKMKRPGRKVTSVLIMATLITLMMNVTACKKDYQLKDNVLEEYLNRTFKTEVFITDVEYEMNESGIAGGTCNYTIKAKDKNGKDYTIELQGHYYGPVNELWGSMVDEDGNGQYVDPGGRLHEINEDEKED